MPSSASARSSSWPAGPTKGRPCRSSWSPGCSPTNISFACFGPSPGTARVACSPIGHSRQRCERLAQGRQAARRFAARASPRRHRRAGRGAPPAPFAAPPPGRRRGRRREVRARVAAARASGRAGRSGPDRCAGSPPRRAPGTRRARAAAAPARRDSAGPAAASKRSPSASPATRQTTRPGSVCSAQRRRQAARKPAMSAALASVTVRGVAPSPGVARERRVGGVFARFHAAGHEHVRPVDAPSFTAPRFRPMTDAFVATGCTNIRGIHLAPAAVEYTG